jgi:hypothetical protein
LYGAAVAEVGPFAAFRMMVDSPGFTAAVDALSQEERAVRYEVAAAYAVWWPPAVRAFRQQQLTLLARDAAWLQLREATERAELQQARADMLAAAQRIFVRGRTPLLLGAVLDGSRRCGFVLWATESLERAEIVNRHTSIERHELAARAELVTEIRELAQQARVPWGDYAPPEYTLALRRKAEQDAAVRRRQEAAVRRLAALYDVQRIATSAALLSELHIAETAQRQRLQWQWEDETSRFA